MKTTSMIWGIIFSVLFVMNLIATIATGAIMLTETEGSLTPQSIGSLLGLCGLTSGMLACAVMSIADALSEERSFLKWGMVAFIVSAAFLLMSTFVFAGMRGIAGMVVSLILFIIYSVAATYFGKEMVENNNRRSKNQSHSS